MNLVKLVLNMPFAVLIAVIIKSEIAENHTEEAIHKPVHNQNRVYMVADGNCYAYEFLDTTGKDNSVITCGDKGVLYERKECDEECKNRFISPAEVLRPTT